MTEAQKENFDTFRELKIKDLIFFVNIKKRGLECNCPNILINQYSNFSYCGSFAAVNNPKFYSSKFLYWNKNTKNKILNVILHEHFPFLKIFLRVKNDKKLFKKLFLSKKYHSTCEFCLEIMKNNKKIEKLNSYSKIEMIYMIISNLHRISYLLVRGLKFEILSYNYLDNFMEKLMKIL